VNEEARHSQLTVPGFLVIHLLPELFTPLATLRDRRDQMQAALAD
jgi:hypothetical protein